MAMLNNQMVQLAKWGPFPYCIADHFNFCWQKKRGSHDNTCGIWLCLKVMYLKIQWFIMVPFKRTVSLRGADMSDQKSHMVGFKNMFQSQCL